MRGIKIKPLEWEQNLGGVWKARTAFGTSYSVADRQWSYGPAMVWFWVEEGDDAAKAAAQADYEARIMAALTPAPADEVRRAALMEAAAVALRHLSKVQINEPLWHEGQDWAAQRISEAILALIEKDTK